MNFFMYCFRKVNLYFYNKRNSTKICSVYASLNANYGARVQVAHLTTVTDDVSIGDYSYVNKGSYIENCIIGKFCSISSGVYICPTEHDHRMRTTHPIIKWGETTMPRPKVIIGNDVLISLNVIILEGVKVGDGAVIGAGAVITKDVQPYEIVGGIPAKHIKYRFSKDEIENLQTLKWWDWDIETIKKNINYLKFESDIIYK